MDIPFVGGSYQGRSKNINSQRCINWFPTADKEGGKREVSLLNTPGLTEYHDFSVAAPVRALRVMGDNLYAVVGATLYELTPAKAQDGKGELSSSEGQVFMADNGNQIVMADRLRGYLYEGGGEDFVKNIADVSSGFPGASSVTFQDGYFIASRPDTAQFWISSLNDGTSWSATDYATAEGKPDSLKSAFSFNHDLWLHGDKTTEVWYNSGNADFPFSRMGKGVLEVGIGAAASIAQSDEALFWFDDTRQARMAVGYNSRVISPPQLNYQFSTYVKVDDAAGYVFTIEGYTFYVLTFPTADKTWMYCQDTNFWNEWSSYPKSGRHRSNCYAYFDGKHIVGDFENGKLYELDLDVYADDGNDIIRTRTTSSINQDRKRLFFYSLEVEFESGVGLQSGQGSDPQAMLQWSNDGGHTWSNEVWADIGKVGRYKNRAIWRRLGSGRDYIFQLRVSDPVKAVVIGANAEVELGQT